MKKFRCFMQIAYSPNNALITVSCRLRGGCERLPSPCIVFAGYSLYDIDVGRVLKTFEGMQDRIFFIVTENTSRATVKKLPQFGSVLNIGVDGLAKIVAAISLEANPVSEVYLSAWEQVSFPKSESSPLKDTDVTNFLMAGSVDSNIFGAPGEAGAFQPVEVRPG